MRLKTFKMRELKRLLRKHGLVFATNSGKGSHQAVVNIKTGKTVATVTVHGGSTEMSGAVLKQFLRRCGLDPKAVS